MEKPKQHMKTQRYLPPAGQGRVILRKTCAYNASIVDTNSKSYLAPRALKYKYDQF